jgi:hypothetical protein
VSEQKHRQEYGDPLIEEVRAIRREIGAQFGHDVERLCEHLREVQRDYSARRGPFAGVSADAARRVAEGWGPLDANEDAIVDELRAIRRAGG